MYSNNQWEEGPAGPLSGGFPHSACIVKMDQDRVLLAGGFPPYVKSPHERTSLDAAWIFNIKDGTWTEIEGMNHALQSHGCVRLPQGDVMMAGRRYDGQWHEFLVEILDQDSLRWTTFETSGSVDTPYTSLHLVDGQVILLDQPNSTFYRLEGPTWLPLGGLPGFNDGLNTGAVAVPNSFACP